MAMLDHYIIRETLLEGAAVALYRGVRKRDGVRVIIKALRAESPAPRGIERLRRECEIGRQLDSLYVIRPYDIETHGAQLMLILEASAVSR
jgi:hypothetical protein